MGNTNNSIQQSIKTDDLSLLKHYVKSGKYKNAKLRPVDCLEFISEEIKEYLTNECLIRVEIINRSESKKENTPGDTLDCPPSRKHSFKSSDTTKDSGLITDNKHSNPACSGVAPDPTSGDSTIHSGTYQLSKEVVKTEDLTVVLTIKTTRVEIDARYALKCANVSLVDLDNTILLVLHKTSGIEAAEDVKRVLYRHDGIQDTFHVPYQNVTNQGVWRILSRIFSYFFPGKRQILVPLDL